MTVITVCIIILTDLTYILRYFSSSSEVSIYSQIYITFTYIPLPIFTSDKLVMSRGNSKIFTYAFCKSEALQFICPLLGEDYKISKEKKNYKRTLRNSLRSVSPNNFVFEKLLRIRREGRQVSIHEVETMLVVLGEGGGGQAANLPLSPASHRCPT
jgi:hypothetical protein